jgi:NAD(P)-dependent dehydrogenase (short-subunit alcohol dehydrogenase family)
VTTLDGSGPTLEERVALVTGAGRGIGRSIALAMARAGASVILVSRTRTDLESVAAEIDAAGGDAIVCPVDVTSAGAFESALASTPVADIVVNSAGINRPQPFAEVDEATFDLILGTNLRAMFFVTQATVRRLRSAARPGVVLNISSQMGHVGARNRTVYCASKHAVEGLTKALGVELGPDGIRVVSIAPTFIETPMTLPFLTDPVFQADVLASIPLGRLGTLEEVAAAAVFLVSPAASLITGSSVLLDGGWTAR